MGIYDRDYYRREGPGFFGGLAEQGRVTVWLLGLNIVCFLIQFLTRSRGEAGGWSEPFTDALALDPARVMAGEVWRLGTFAFLHSTDNILHILMNMLLLYMFGRQVEEVIGSKEYALFYAAATLVAGSAFFAASLAGFHGPFSVCVGASGGVMAVLVAAAMIFPRQKILLFFVLPVPIWAFAAGVVASDLVPFLRMTSGGVATSAHLGGAAFGFVYRWRRWRLSGWTEWTRTSATRRKEPQLRLYREDEDEVETPRPTSPRREAPTRTAPAPAATRPVVEDEHLEAQLDSILAKISREGMSGLTEQERLTLSRASEAIKKRRS